MRIYIIFLILFFTLSIKSLAQVEIPETRENCKLMNTGKFWYCIDESTYHTHWTSIKIERSDIENRVFFPIDKDYFPEISKLESDVWLKLENQVKFWSIEFDSVFVTTGSFVAFDSIQNTNNIFFYKAILKGCKGDAIGFLIGKEQNSENIISYAIPVDSLEIITGFNFFPTLNKDLQVIIESEFNPDFWPVSLP